MSQKNKMLSTLNFDVHAYIMIHLGDQLITDEITAVSELVKNSYDADASFVEINIDPNWSNNTNDELAKGKIEIKDNGVGMSLKQIKEGWLTLGTSEKRIMKQFGRVTAQHNRLPLGDKGLGRLSAQRLGNGLTLVTKQKGEPTELKVYINWLDFFKDMSLSKVPIQYEAREVTKGELNRSYTHLIITDLRDREKWMESKKVDEFETRLSKIVSPFDFNRKFFIIAKVGERKLETPQIGKEILNLALVQYEFKVDNKKIEISGKYRLEYFPQSGLQGDRLKEFVDTVQDKLSKNNLSYLNEGRFIFEYKKTIPLRSLGEFRLDFHPGSFTGFIYDFSLDRAVFMRMTGMGELKQFNKASDLNKYIKTYNGIKIFRDDFKISPYGELGDDWLGLGRNFTSGGSFYFLRPQNVIGYVNLTGKNNKNLREKTDREGFVEDEYSNGFFGICKHIVGEINKNREFLRRSYNDYLKQIEEHKEAKTDNVPSYKVAKEKIIKATDFAENISAKTAYHKKEIQRTKEFMHQTRTQIINLPKKEKENVENLLEKIERLIIRLERQFDEISQNVVTLQEARASSVALVKQIEITMNQVQEVMELAGFGLTAELLTHELFTLVNNTKNDVRDFRLYFRKSYEDDIKIEAFMDSILSRVEALRKQVTHLSPGFRMVRTRKELLDMQEFISEHISYYLPRAKRNGIEIINKSNKEDSFTVYTNKGLLVQIFDNLYSNAEYWLLHAFKNKLIKEKKIFIQVFSSGVIHIWDSGLGIDKNIEDTIFEPFITSKTEGRGLGLYIIDSILQNWDCNIRLMEPRNEFGNRYKFSLHLSNMMQVGDET